MPMVVNVQYIPRNMHTVFALLCFVVVIHRLIFPYLSGLLHWHCGNLTIATVPAKQPWWIWINTSCEFTMNDCITTTKQSTTKPCAYFLGYTVYTDITYHCRAFTKNQTWTKTHIMVAEIVNGAYDQTHKWGMVGQVDLMNPNGKREHPRIYSDRSRLIIQTGRYLLKIVPRLVHESLWWGRPRIGNRHNYDPSGVKIWSFLYW